MKLLKLNFLDHVAIRVNDIQRSVNWYSKVLGLKMYAPEEWGGIPVFMLAGKSGVALFPIKTGEIGTDNGSPPIRIDHFAFNVDIENFNNARLNFEELAIPYDFQDHYYFHSLYIKDPDGHAVELTTLMVDESDFYSL